MELVIAGAGPAGLFTAWKLAEKGFKVTVVEKAPIVGGLAASIKKGENFYSFGTHHLHNPNPELLEPFKKLMGPELYELKRRLQIKFMGHFFPYPLTTKDIIKGMPLGLLLLSTAGLMKELFLRRFRKGPPKNAEEAIIRLYGKKLYEVMFKEYTTQFWGVDPTRISHLFVEKRMPGVNAVEEIKKLLSRIGLVSKASLGKNITIGSGSMYTTSKGVGAVFERIQDRIQALGGSVLCSSKLVSLTHEKQQIRSIKVLKDGDIKEIGCDMLVSTIPLNHLVKGMAPAAPKDVLESADRLGFRSLIVGGFCVRPLKRLNAMFTYFPDRVFHRLAEVQAPPAKIHPKGAALLLGEFTCNRDDKLWKDPEILEEQIVSDLLKEDLIADKDDLLESHYLKAPHAYPKYALGFEKDLERIKGFLGEFKNLKSTGRNGAFQFFTMVPSMQAAWKDTKELLAQNTAAID